MDWPKNNEIFLSAFKNKYKFNNNFQKMEMRGYFINKIKFSIKYFIETTVHKSETVEPCLLR